MIGKRFTLFGLVVSAVEATALRGHKMRLKILTKDKAYLECDRCNTWALCNNVPSLNNVHISGTAVSVTCNKEKDNIIEAPLRNEGKASV
jgi:hypothetical protein